MRHLILLVVALTMVACRNTPPVPDDVAETSRDAIANSAARDASRDSAVQFLLAASATDFHTHRPPDPAQFRDVRAGYVETESGERQYVLCGQFLPAAEGSSADWTGFATIMTDPYEQWLGDQATAFCQNPAIVWDDRGDLSAELWSRFSSLR